MVYSWLQGMCIYKLIFIILSTYVYKYISIKHCPTVVSKYIWMYICGHAKHFYDQKLFKKNQKI